MHRYLDAKIFRYLDSKYLLGGKRDIRHKRIKYEYLVDTETLETIVYYFARIAGGGRPN